MIKLQTMMNNDIFAMVNYYRSTGKLLKQFILNTLYLNPFFFMGRKMCKKLGEVYSVSKYCNSQFL